MHLIDPDTTLRHEAILRAIQYTARRLVEILGWKRNEAGPVLLAWFFQSRIPFKYGDVRPVDGWAHKRYRKSGRPMWEW